MKANQIMIFHPSDSRSGLRVARVSPSRSGCKAGSTLDSPFHHRAAPIYSHSDWDPLDRPLQLTFTALGCGRKPESIEKTYTDLKRMCTHHTDNGTGLESVFSLVNINIR